MCHLRTRGALFCVRVPSAVPILDTSCPRLYGPTVYVSGHRVYSVKKRRGASPSRENQILPTAIVVVVVVVARPGHLNIDVRHMSNVIDQSVRVTCYVKHFSVRLSFRRPVSLFLRDPGDLNKQTENPVNCFCEVVVFFF